jgi:hypothetical protein
LILLLARCTKPDIYLGLLLRFGLCLTNLLPRLRLCLANLLLRFGLCVTNLLLRCHICVQSGDLLRLLAIFLLRCCLYS